MLRSSHPNNADSKMGCPASCSSVTHSHSCSLFSPLLFSSSLSYNPFSSPATCHLSPPHHRLSLQNMAHDLHRSVPLFHKTRYSHVPVARSVCNCNNCLLHRQNCRKHLYGSRNVQEVSLCSAVSEVLHDFAERQTFNTRSQKES
jgi:hypothetical protein